MSLWSITGIQKLRSGWNMNFFEQMIALRTIIRKEIQRFLRIWIQTIIPPSITIVLYFVVFGNLIGPRI